MQRIERFISKVRSEPKQIRLRYVWSFVAVSMLFVFLLWILSVRVLLGNDADSKKSSAPLPKLPELESPLKKIPGEAPSIDAITQPSAQPEGFSNSAAQEGVR